MKLFHVEAEMNMGCKVTYHEGTLTITEVPSEQAQALLKHLDKFKSRAERGRKHKEGGNGHALREVLYEAAPVPVGRIENPSQFEIPAVIEKEGVTPIVTPSLAGAKEGVTPIVTPSLAGAVEDPFATAFQLQDIVHILVADLGYTDVEKIVVECRRLHEAGHPALARIGSTLDDRVRRRAIKEGLEI